ncbi:MAG TPA: hypothetical protein VE621_04355 [Bryobacteraceae bacterium]|jgi:hypothetical protein|nr:hypothetical protein [Bryobacteraceae bacterium]
MAGYLETYRAGEEGREKLLIRAAIGLVAVVIVGVILWFQFRDYNEKKQVNAFLSALNNKDYKRAYEFWGCSYEKPCPAYNFEKFMEDWGPSSPHANVAAAKLKATKSCNAGVIQYVQFPGDEVQLWVDRKNKTLGFAPWPVCNPRMPKG